MNKDYATGFRDAVKAIYDAARARATSTADSVAYYELRNILAGVQMQHLMADKVADQPPSDELRRPRDSGDQPLPHRGGGPNIHEQVCLDVMGRQQLGVRRYGQPLQPHNGRDALLDLYQELLDAACYTRQLLAEKDGR